MFGGNDDHDHMRQTQNGFGKGKWKPGDHEQIGGLQPDDDSDEDEGVDDEDDEDEEEDDNIEQDDDDEESDHNF